MKTLAFIFSVIVSIVVFAVDADAADVKGATSLIANTLKDAGALSNKAGVNNELRISLVKGQAMIEEADANAKLAVTKIDFDTKNGSFNAYVSANNNLPFEVAGTFTETVKLPTLIRKFDKNEVIAKADITYIEIEANKVRDGFITSEDKLIGKAPTHQIWKERPITFNQVADAQVISKNKQLVMVYRSNSLTIRASGIALEGGAIGQAVKIKNLSSNKVVLAKIIDADTAEVRGVSEVASN